MKIAATPMVAGSLFARVRRARLSGKLSLALAWWNAFVIGTISKPSVTLTPCFSYSVRKSSIAKTCLPPLLNMVQYLCREEPGSNPDQKSAEAAQVHIEDWRSCRSGGLRGTLAICDASWPAFKECADLTETHNVTKSTTHHARGE